MESVGATVSVWANPPGVDYSSHAHGYRKVLYCLRGSIVFHLPDADMELAAGRRMVIEPGTVHSASVGPDGVRCAEARFESPTTTGKP